MRVRSHYLCPNESSCLMPLLGGFFLECVFVFLQGLMEFDGGRLSVYTCQNDPELTGPLGFTWAFLDVKDGSVHYKHPIETHMCPTCSLW